MPLIDMPLEEMKSYMGTNVMPEDFDDYWKEALSELDTIDPQVEMTKSEFQVPYAECFDLYFTGVRGARIYAKYLRPKNNNEKHPAILQFHGYGMNSGDWNDKLSYVAMGYTVAALDCRGQGGLSEDVGGVLGTTKNGHIVRGLDDDPKNLLYRHIFLDTVMLARIVMNMPEVDENRIGAMGASQGGGLTLACAALEPRIKKLAPVYPFLSDYKRVWDLDLAIDAYEEIRYYFRLFDPNHLREDEVFRTLGYIDIQNLMKRVKGEVLFTTGLMDTICPPSTQFAAYNKIESPKEMLLYHDYGHENLPYLGDKILQFMSTL